MNSEKQINLKTLQRMDASIVEIIDNSSHVAIYKYNNKLQHWEATDVEGALFLYRRSVRPFHGFIIVNRSNTTNLVETITEDMQCQLNEPYFLYINHAGEIRGSWFYERKDLLRISQKIQAVLSKQEGGGRMRSASESGDSPLKTKGNNILTLLSQAHEKYMSEKRSPSGKIDVNQMAAHHDKVTPIKSVALPLTEVLRSASQEETSASPRRRFMSTGSFDADRSRYYAHEFFSAESFLKVQNLQFKENKSAAKEPPPMRLSPLFSHDEISSPFHNGHSHIDNDQMDWRTCLGPDCDLHLSCIQKSVASHVQDNPKLMLKIHEAYVSSLRSLFAKI